MVYSIDDTYEHLKLLTELFWNSDPKVVVKTILMEMSIPSRYTGIRFLISSIMLYDVDAIGNSGEKLYSEVAAQYGEAISAEHVESCIRDAIREGWRSRVAGAWERYIPSVRAGEDKPPSNIEMISELARILDIWCGMRETYIRGLREREVRYAIK